MWRFTFLIATCWFYGCQTAKHAENQYDIFTLNLSAPITSLDPAFASDQPNSWACHQIYNGLVQLDKELKVTPCIAKDWEVSEDLLTYTFRLRTDIFFHNNLCFPEGKGRLLTANDVSYSFSRLLDPATAARGMWVFQDIVDSAQPFTIVNDSTLVIQLEKPFAPFLQRLCMPYCSVVPFEAIEYYGKDFRSNPVGTGPFKFAVWDEGQVLILHKNEHYFEKDHAGKQLPYLDAVNFKFVGNKSTEFLQFMNGELDFVSDIDGSLKNQILTLDGRLQERYAGEIKLLKSPYLNVEYLSILMESGEANSSNPLQNKSVRQAMNMAFNRADMILFLRNNRGIPATTGMVPPSLRLDSTAWTHGYEYDVKKAMQLLSDAGFPNGNGLPEMILHTTPEYQDFAVYLKDKWADIGLKVKIETVDPRLLREMRLRKETLLFRSSWIADYSDAESYLQVFLGKAGSPPNYTRYQNQTYDSLYMKATSTLNDFERDRLYRQMDSLLMQDAPVIPLFYDEVFRFTKNNVQGLEPDALNMLDLKAVYFSDIEKTMSPPANVSILPDL